MALFPVQFKTTLAWLQALAHSFAQYNKKKHPHPRKSVALGLAIHFIPWLLKRYKKFIISTILFVGVGGFVLFFLFILKDLPSPEKLNQPGTIAYSSHIYSRDNKLLYEIFHDQNRTPITLNNLPNHVKWATIAIEDKDFYKHQGISVFGGMLRALRDTVLGKKLQGGSTITQQLVKSALLTPERTIERKVKEIILALLVERTYTKDQILEMYLNQVPYGGTAWGIEEASRLYFGKGTKQLKLHESALLAGLPQAPTSYSPFSNPTAAKNRQVAVLQRMLEEKYISKTAFDNAVKTKLVYATSKTSIFAPHFVFYVKEILEKEYGLKTVQEGGLRVYTTLDYSLQKQAETILNEELDELKDLNVGNGAALVTRPSTGEIIVMVGSRDFFSGQYGAYNVTTALRQPGSSIKPLNYAIGIERRLVTAGTMFLDTPTCFNVPFQKAYCPQNYDGKFHGPAQVRFALANSYNIPAVKMLAVNGVTDFIASASAMGISTFTDPSRYGLSLTLGGGEVKMTDMAKAFSVFSNQGIATSLTPILKVTDRFGKVLYEYKNPNVVKDIEKPLDYPNYLYIPGKRVLSRETTFIISHILLDPFARLAAFGTGSYLVVPGRSGVSVKTGTTDDLRDNWTIGYNPNFLATVWVGNNDNSPMNPYLTSGITGAAPIWNRIMQAVLKNQKDLWPKKPDNVTGLQICSISGLLPSNDDEESRKNCGARFEYFIKGTEPKTRESLKQRVRIDKNTNRLASQSQTDNVEEQEKLVIRDQFSTYCIDCNHDAEGSAIVNMQ